MDNLKIAIEDTKQALEAKTTTEAEKMVLRDVLERLELELCIAQHEANWALL